MKRRTISYLGTCLAVMHAYEREFGPLPSAASADPTWK
jgi:hypothetical protein